MRTRELIESNPAIMMGKPVIVGTRITVELIIEKLAAGETVEQLLVAHPRLTREAIQAALAFAAEALRADVKSEIVNRAFKEHAPHLEKAFAVLTPDHLRVRRALNLE